MTCASREALPVTAAADNSSNRGGSRGSHRKECRGAAPGLPSKEAMGRLMGEPSSLPTGEPLARMMSVDTDQSVWYLFHDNTSRPLWTKCSCNKRASRSLKTIRAGNRSQWLFLCTWKKIWATDCMHD